MGKGKGGEGEGEREGRGREGRGREGKGREGVDGTGRDFGPPTFKNVPAPLITDGAQITTQYRTAIRYTMNGVDGYGEYEVLTLHQPYANP